MNQSINETTWTANGVTFRELIRQEYTNCIFSAGQTDHDIDGFYIRLEKGNRETFVMMRPDEVAALNWLCAGLLWSIGIAHVDENGQYIDPILDEAT